MSLHHAIQTMLEKYHCQTKAEYANALKEIIQEVALLGLSRNNFFSQASFYGGSALRIAHGLDRFSEDLDFEKLPGVQGPNLASYFNGIKEELQTFNLHLTIEKKYKKNSTVESAFLKGNTVKHLLKIDNIDDPTSGFSKNDIIKIRLEIDMNPPVVSANHEIKFHNEPIPFEYRILDLPSLYAGKLHAILCRNWNKKRVKGRDFYDLLWYQRKNIAPNYEYLKGKLVQSEVLTENQNFNAEVLKSMLDKKFEQVDWEQAKEDVRPFIRDRFAIAPWSSRFFKEVVIPPK